MVTWVKLELSILDRVFAVFCPSNAMNLGKVKKYRKRKIEFLHF